jgi:hypothetical protein
MGTPVTPARKLIYVEGAQFRSATSEELIQRLAATNNFISLYQYDVYDFKANGLYNVNLLNETGFDGIYVFPFDMEIFFVAMYNTTPGSSGTTSIDIKRTTGSGTTFSTIFTTVPAITTAADHTDVAYIYTGGSGTGLTAPVLSSTPFNVSAGQAIRADFISKQAGLPENCGILVYFRPR